MFKLILPTFALLLLLILANNSRNYAAEPAGPTTPDAKGESGTLQRRIVESGSIAMQLDVNRLNGIISSVEAGMLATPKLREGESAVTS